ncbi:unnamed protein product, partial [Adineta ricciae]
MYYFYTQNQSSIKDNVGTYLKRFGKNSDGTDPIRTVFESEYDHDDLEVFYNLVSKEFALGLRCMRKPDQPVTTSNSNLNDTDQMNSNRTQDRSAALQKNHNQSSSISNASHGFRYSFIIANADACSYESVDLLIIVISKSDNYKTRDAIRRTWDFDEKLNQNIRLENKIFRDIIQVELPQQYTLVTHRELALWEWSLRYCHSAKFLFKTDDDVFVNLVALLKFMSPLRHKPRKNA